MLNTNKIQVKWLSIDFMSIPLRLHPDLFHIAATFDLGMVEHLLHLCNSIIQLSDGNKATTYNSLQKNIIEMKFFPVTFIVCPCRSF